MSQPWLPRKRRGGDGGDIGNGLGGAGDCRSGGIPLLRGCIRVGIEVDMAPFAVGELFVRVFQLVVAF